MERAFDEVQSQHVAVAVDSYRSMEQVFIRV